MLDAKVASMQLLGAYNLGVLPAELSEADFIARGRLSDSLTNWLATQSLFKGMQASYHMQSGNEIPDIFVDHLESTKGIVSSLFTNFKYRTENFFKARKACRDKNFMSCPNNLRTDLLLKSSPFFILLFEQGVINTLLTELRTADKDLQRGFGKKSFPDKCRSRCTSTKGKNLQRQRS